MLETAGGTGEPRKPAALTGADWDAISRYIRDHLEETITVDALAAIARMPPARFGYPKKYKAIVLNAADYRGY